MFDNYSKSTTSTFFNMKELSSGIQSHLLKVYGNLSVMFLLSIIGNLLFLNRYITNITVFSILSFVSLLSIPFISRENKSVRFSAAYIFAFSKGVILGPLIASTMYFNPGVVTTALFSCFFAFASFSISAILSKRRSYLFLGGIIGSSVLCLLTLSTLNIFFRSLFIEDISLYLGVLVFSAYVIYDTQIIIEKADQGYYDVVGDSLNLYVDFFALLIRVIIILKKNQEKKEKEERERRRR